MAQNIIQYKLLISCPSDIKDEISIIRDVIKQFNEQYTDVLGIEVKEKHWSTDSYSQSGERPQSILNEQIVNDCDAAVAVFWSRFGTPTGRYGSGTEEEIELMLEKGRQVFMYFSEKPLSPELFNAEEQARIKEFRDKYMSRGLYFTYSSNEEFRKLFFAHLSKYFISKKSLTEAKNRFSLLKLMGINENKELIENPVIVVFKPHVKQSIEEYKTEIVKAMEDVSNIHLKRNLDGISNKSFEFSLYTPMEIEGNIRDLITNTSKAAAVNLSDDFFDLGGLSRNSIPIGLMGSELKGTEQEKEKYKKIQELYNKILSFISWCPVEDAFKDMKCLMFALKNDGTDVDRDVEITIKLPKDTILKTKDFPCFDNETKGYLLNDCDMREMFGIPATQHYLDYDDSMLHPRISPTVSVSIPGYTPDFNDDYAEELQTVFYYSLFEDELNDILRVKVDYIKHKTAVAFPSVIFIKAQVDEISYSISSQCNPTTIEGSLKVEK